MLAPLASKVKNSPLWPAFSPEIAYLKEIIALMRTEDM